jgi:ketosteroid isomerase-like protein
MARENVEIVRHWLEVFNRGPEKARAAVSEFWDADSDYYPVRKFPEARPCHGREEIAEFLAGFCEAWSVDYEIGQIVEVGDDRVLACTTLSTSGRSSEIKLEGDLYFCVWLRRGRLIRQEDHLTQRGALRALGLQGDTLEAAGLRAGPGAAGDEQAVTRNADTVRRGIDAFNAFHRGELSIEAIAEEFDPQIEMIWRDRQTYPDFPQHLRGLPEVITFAEQYRDGWIDLVQEPLELIEAPDARVVVLVRQSGRGRQSAVPIVIHFFALYTIRDGRARRIEYFRHRADALRAARLSG